MLVHGYFAQAYASLIDMSLQQVVPLTERFGGPAWTRRFGHNGPRSKLFARSRVARPLKDVTIEFPDLNFGGWNGVYWGSLVTTPTSKSPTLHTNQNGRLTEVRWTHKIPSNGPALRDILVARYGPPLEPDRNGALTWSGSQSKLALHSINGVSSLRLTPFRYSECSTSPEFAHTHQAPDTPLG